MDDIKKRLAQLRPEQRALLEQQMKHKGLELPSLDQATPPARKPAPSRRTRSATRSMDFSLFFFSSDGTLPSNTKYQLLMESARYADEYGFSAVWTPERHFQTFGGLYPNPAVISAALAVSTRRLQIRAGSVVVPLHHPIRIAEDWAVVDNLSNGRVAICCASGWHPVDFILAPQPSVTSYEDRKEAMFDAVQLIKRLWAGETVEWAGIDGNNVAVASLPRPLQPELPIWIASQGSPETFIRAGEIGASVLTGLVGQSFADVAKKISLYREALVRSGYAPDHGKVSVMVHTFLGADDDIVREQVRGPLTSYLRSFIAQQENTDTGYAALSEDDKRGLIGHAFDNYFETTGLLGTVEKCEHLIEELADVGADEVACLIDFGLAPEMVLDGLHYLNELRARYDHTRSIT